MKDTDTAEKLKPWYKLGCKRPCFHDDYLPAFNRDNVTLVDTDGHGVEGSRTTASSPTAQEYPVDILIYASGFEVLTFYTHRLGFDPKGEDGVSLSEAWAKGPSTLLRHHVARLSEHVHEQLDPGRPGRELCVHADADRQADRLRDRRGARARCGEGGADSQAQEEWFDPISGTVLPYGTYMSDCTPGYLNNESVAPSEYEMKIGCYMGSACDWSRILEAWRDEGTLEASS